MISAISTAVADALQGQQNNYADYDNQMQKYYQAYFNQPQTNTGMLSDWYSGTYTPDVTGYQRPQIAPQQFVGTNVAAPTDTGSGGIPMGSGGFSAPVGGQGINNSLVSGGLGMMAMAENPMMQGYSPLIAALMGIVGGQVVDGQIDGMSAAAAKAEAASALSNLGIQTISDADGNIRTISTPESIAAADAGMFSGESSYGNTTGENMSSGGNYSGGYDGGLTYGW